MLPITRAVEAAVLYRGYPPVTVGAFEAVRASPSGSTSTLTVMLPAVKDVSVVDKVIPVTFIWISSTANKLDPVMVRIEVRAVEVIAVTDGALTVSVASELFVAIVIVVLAGTPANVIFRFVPFVPVVPLPVDWVDDLNDDTEPSVMTNEAKESDAVLFVKRLKVPVLTVAEFAATSVRLPTATVPRIGLNVVMALPVVSASK
jgi:hypothetical protein